MKSILASTISLLAIGVMSCSQPDVVVSPSPYSGAKGSSGGGGGGGGSTTPPTTTTTTTPTSLPELTPNPTPINDLGPVMPTGTWTVKTYYRGFSDNTSDFSSCKLVFSPGGSLSATDSRGDVYYGSWYATIGGQIPYYGGAPSITALTMSFSKSAPKQFYRLSAVWNVNLATATSDVVLDNFEPLSGERIEFVK